MAGQYDDWSLEQLIEEFPGEFANAVWTLSTDDAGNFDRIEFSKLAVALAEIEEINLIRTLDEQLEEAGLSDGQESRFPKRLKRRFDDMDWFLRARA